MGSAAAPAAISRQDRRDKLFRIPEWLAAEMAALGCKWTCTPQPLSHRLIPWMGGPQGQGVGCAILLLIHEATAGNWRADYPEWTGPWTHDFMASATGYTREAIRDAL